MEGQLFNGAAGGLSMSVLLLSAASFLTGLLCGSLEVGRDWWRLIRVSASCCFGGSKTAGKLPDFGKTNQRAKTMVTNLVQSEQHVATVHEIGISVVYPMGSTAGGVRVGCCSAWNTPHSLVIWGGWATQWSSGHRTSHTDRWIIYPRVDESSTLFSKHASWSTRTQVWSTASPSLQWWRLKGLGDTNDFDTRWCHVIQTEA